MKNSDKIQADPEALKARLNQRYTTLAEALKQLQATMPLSPAGLRALRKSKNVCANGPVKTEN